MTRRRLQDEIKQSRPFRSAGQEAALALLRTADEIRRQFSEVAARAGITLQQYNVLRILRGTGPAGLPTLEIAARMIERTPGITRLIDRLEGAGLVERERSDTDRRTVICRATAAGLRLLAELDAPVDAANERVLAMLSPRELRDLVRTLERVRTGASPGSPAADPASPRS